MVQDGRRTSFFVSAAAAVLLALGFDAAWAQPPVAKPQPPPKPVTATPGTTTPPPGTTTTAPGATTPGTAAPAGTRTPAPAVEPASAASRAEATAALTAEQPPTEAFLGSPVMPNAQFLGSYDAGGAGQRFYLYGTVQRFNDVVNYYKTVLKQKGELVFEVPATHMFEVGKFREEQVAFPPGVTVKDYTTGGSPGLPNPKFGATPAAFPTVIQIVPPAVVPAPRR